MAKFMSTHTLPPGGMTRDQVCQFADAAQHDPLVKGYRSFVNLSAGRAFCVLEARDSQAVEAWFERMGMPHDGVVRVELEGDQGLIHEV